MRRASAGMLLRAASALASPPPRGGVALEAASALLPHPAKAAKGGEDACFCGSSVFGVFDGVGGWASRGIDAGQFSRDLAKNTHAELVKTPDGDLTNALEAGLRDVQVLGSCTACLLKIDRQAGTLSALNLGDSGWRLFRPAGRALRIEHASEAQQHYFNCPLQLGGGSMDKPSDGDVFKATVYPGDLVLMATDGVLDNLFDEEIAELLASAVQGDLAGAAAAVAPSAGVGADASAVWPSASHLANLVAASARAASVSKTRNTPFAVGAAENGYTMPGGKVDDITVVCVKVLAPDDAEAPPATPRSRL